MNDKKKAFIELFYKNAGYVAVVLISLIYIASSLILISKTGKSVYEIIATGALSMVVGILITGIFRSIGIQRGDADERTVATDRLHSETVESVIQYVDLLDSFCEVENERALKSLRARILAKEGLKYDECFDERGVSLPLSADENAKNYKRKVRAYNKAVNLKIKPLVASNLTAEGANTEDPFNFGKTKKQYTAQGSTSDIVTRAIMAIVFGYFGVAFASEINFGAIIWNTLQVIMYICSGVMQMHSSYIWVVNDYRYAKIRKIDLLDKFRIYAEQERSREVNAIPHPSAELPPSPPNKGEGNEAINIEEKESEENAECKD